MYKRISHIAFSIAGIFFLLVIWKYLSIKLSSIVVASPTETFTALKGLITDIGFMKNHLLVSIKRIFLTLFFAVLMGGITGVFAGIFENIKRFLEPLRWMLMTVPGVVVVIVFMLLLGMGDKMVITLGTAMTAPVIYTNVSAAVIGVDRKLLEMARIYRFSFLTKLFKIYGNALTGPFFASTAIAAGNGIRIVVLSEVLGAESGIGYLLSISRTNLDTPSLYALALLSMTIAGGIEILFLKPLKQKFLWRS